nr:immunoglobulin light chain junction region [Macaca mulatta]MOX56227.1 immunoglobulin light chain junction region [Macaca mulatta]
CHQYNSFPFTF